MDRERALRKIQRRLSERGWPRLQVSAGFLAAALVAFGSSYGLLRLGLSDMAIRYVVSVSLGYLVFLLLLRFFVSAIRRKIETDAGPLDALDLFTGADLSGSSGHSLSDDCIDPSPAEPVDSLPDLPLPDEAVSILVPLLAVGAGILSAIYVVYVAPALLAELVLDVVVVSRLARRAAIRSNPGSALES